MAGKGRKEKKAKESEDAGVENSDVEATEASAGDGNGEGSAEGQGKAKSKKKLSGRTLVLFIALPAVLAIGLGIGAAFMFGLFGGGEEDAKAAEEAAKKAAEAAVYFDVPELLVNLSSTQEGHDNLLKISMSLELPGADSVAKVQAALPRIVDGAQVFLREMRISDLDGSAGMLKLREELLKRVNAAVSPLAVRDVLFKEVIVQ